MYLDFITCLGDWTLENDVNTEFDSEFAESYQIGTWSNLKTTIAKTDYYNQDEHTNLNKMVCNNNSLSRKKWVISFYCFKISNEGFFCCKANNTDIFIIQNFCLLSRNKICINTYITTKTRCFHNFIIFYSEKKLNYKILIYFQVSEFCFKSKRKKWKL